MGANGSTPGTSSSRNGGGPLDHYAGEFNQPPPNSFHSTLPSSRSYPCSDASLALRRVTVLGIERSATGDEIKKA